MSEVMESIYDKHIANEKLKSGSKYERLAAIVYKALDEESIVIHDLRLRGEGKTAEHQIDVTIEKFGICKRILIECKDYDDVVGIGIIRDFFGAVSQIKPDEAIVVTTKGFTRGAKRFADDENIKLGLLREFKEDDWTDRMRRIHIKMKMLFMDTSTITSWTIADKSRLEEIKAKLVDKEGQVDKINTTNTYFVNENGEQDESFQEVLKPIFNSLPRIPGEKTKGKYEFEKVRHINLYGVLVPVRGFEYEFKSYEVIHTSTIDEGTKIAVLLLKTIDNSIDTTIFDQDLEKWTFDDEGQVIPRKG